MAMASEDGPRGPGDPSGDGGELFWSVGQAADRAGVTHRRIVEELESGRLEGRTVGREGVEIRLVRAADVIALHPAAGRAVPAGCGDASAAEVSAVGRARLRTEVERLGIAPPAAPPDREGSAPAVAEAAPVPPAGADAPGPSALPPAVERPRSAGLLVPIALGVALGLTGAILVVENGGPTGVAASTVAAEPEPGALPEAPSAVQVEDSGADEHATPATERAAQEFAAEESAAEESAADVPPPPGSNTATRAAAPATTASDAVEAVGPRTAGPTIESAPSVAVSGDDDAEPSTPDAIGPPATDTPRDLADLQPPSARSVAAHRTCAYAPLVDGDAKLRLALGPCIGAHVEGASAAPGTHRVDGVPCCAHHAFVERMTGASADADAVDTIVSEAAAAERDGLLPPLLHLRAERSATLFLRDLLGTWTESGIGRAARGLGPVDGSEHRWTRLDAEGDALRMQLESWVQLEEGTPRRRFVLVLELDDGPRGDRRASFRWTGAAAADHR